MIDGTLVPTDTGGDPLQRLNTEELQQLGEEMPWEDISNDDLEIEIYEPYDDFSNRERMAEFARENPSVVFVTAAGNIHSFAPLGGERPPNLLTVGELFHSSMLF
ncbi:MAG: hypothetical protein ACE5DX_02915 [Candidatus Dojkabacteria bacterium]